MPDDFCQGVTRETMQAIDRRAIEEYGIPALVLMEHAGKGVAEICMKHFGVQSSVAVACGKGNNGGDGFVAARHLWNAGVRVDLYLFAEESSLKPDPRVYFEICKKLGMPITSVDLNQKLAWHPNIFQKHAVWVDALFGVGLKNRLREPYLLWIHALNRAERDVLAVDIPSGLDANTGEVMGAAVKAQVTAAMALPKTGFYKGEGPSSTGKIEVVDIGLPRTLLEGL